MTTLLANTHTLLDDLEEICTAHGVGLELVRVHGAWTCAILDPDDGCSYIVTAGADRAIYSNLHDALFSLRAKWERHRDRKDTEAAQQTHALQYIRGERGGHGPQERDGRTS